MTRCREGATTLGWLIVGIGAVLLLLMLVMVSSFALTALQQGQLLGSAEVVATELLEMIVVWLALVFAWRSNNRWMFAVMAGGIIWGLALVNFCPMVALLSQVPL